MSETTTAKELHARMVERTGDTMAELLTLKMERDSLLRQRDELRETAEAIRTCETKPGENGTVILTASFDKLLALCTAIANADKSTGTPRASTLEGLQDAVADADRKSEDNAARREWDAAEEVKP